MTQQNAKITKPSDASIPTPAHVDVPDGYLLDQLDGNKFVDEKIRGMIKDVISRDKDIDKEIEKIVEKIANNKLKIFWTKIGAAAWSLFMLILGVILSAVIKKIG